VARRAPTQLAIRPRGAPVAAAADLVADHAADDRAGHGTAAAAITVAIVDVLVAAHLARILVVVDDRYHAHHRSVDHAVARHRGRCQTGGQQRRKQDSGFHGRLLGANVGGGRNGRTPTAAYKMRAGPIDALFIGESSACRIRRRDGRRKSRDPHARVRTAGKNFRNDS
jgi:hypothetical protein